MNKFHMTPNGPRRCTASKRPCIYAADGADATYGNLKEATAAYESNSGNAFSKGSKDSFIKEAGTTTRRGRLLLLASHNNADVRITVAANSKMSSKIAESLIDDSDSAVRAELAMNPSVSESQLARLAEDSDGLVRVSVLSNEKVSPEIVESVVVNGGLSEALAASESVSGRLSDKTYESLLKSRDVQVCAYLVQGVGTPVSVVESSIIAPRVGLLALDRDDLSGAGLERAWDVVGDGGFEPPVQRFIDHPNVSAGLLEGIAGDDSFGADVRESARLRLSQL